MRTGMRRRPLSKAAKLWDCAAGTGRTASLASRAASVCCVLLVTRVIDTAQKRKGWRTLCV